MPQTDVPGLTTNNAVPEAELRSDCQKLIATYDELVSSARIGWTTSLRLKRRLGKGAQGTVYLAERIGADGFQLPVAIKFFSPERYRTAQDYDQDMVRLARISSQVARIQHENLLVINHFLDRDRLRMMVMEYVEGFDLRSLLTTRMFGLVKDRFSERRWMRFNQSVVTVGEIQPRLKINAAAIVVRDCLAGLAALHREGVTHGDLKPSNIMLNRHGYAKIIDLGSARFSGERLIRQSCTPTYAALEVLDGEEANDASDIASLGYTAIEMLCGRTLLDDNLELPSMKAVKRSLPRKLGDILPSEIRDDRMVSLLTQMIAENPQARINCEEAITAINDLACPGDWDRCREGELDSREGMRIWIEELLEIPV